MNGIGRRGFLRGAGAVLALPWLESLAPAAETAAPRRLLAVCNNLGLVPDRFFPRGEGAGYVASPYLEVLAEHRDQITVFSGVSHPGVDGSHASDVSFLTAAPHPGNGGFRNSISLDQLIAGEIGTLTRFPSLALGVNTLSGRRGLSFTGAGVLIPCEDSAAAVYRKLFVRGTPEEVERQVRRLELGGSVMDAVAGQGRALRGRLGADDRERLDQYETAVRDVERRMSASREWERRPKPAPSAPAPADPAGPADYMEKTRLMYRMARLAFESDSTRLATILLDSNNSPTISVDGAEIGDGYHNLSHHGRNEKKLAQLEAIDRAHMALLGELFGELRKVEERGETLLDRVMVLYGSNLGDANKHTTTNLPILLAGGGFRHGRHLVFDAERNEPLPNLFVSLMRRMGLERDRFASSTGTMKGLEAKD